MTDRELYNRIADLEEALKSSDQWQPISTAPKDGTEIVVKCDHDADPYLNDSNKKFWTPYAAQTETNCSWREGKHRCVAVWGGGWADCESDGGANAPDWWFDANSEFEIPVNPTHWQPLPQPPEDT